MRQIFKICKPQLLLVDPKHLLCVQIVAQWKASSEEAKALKVFRHKTREKLEMGLKSITTHFWVHEIIRTKELRSDWDVPREKSIAYYLDLSEYPETHQKGSDGNLMTMSALVYDEVRN